MFNLFNSLKLQNSAEVFYASLGPQSLSAVFHILQTECEQTQEDTRNERPHVDNSVCQMQISEMQQEKKSHKHLFVLPYT